MNSRRNSSDSNDLGAKDFENLNLSDCTGAKPKFRFPAAPRLAVSANNSLYCSSQSDGSSTSSINRAPSTSIKKHRKKPGFARKLPPMGIFWDIENVCVPKLKSAGSVVSKIREVFLKDYRESEFVVVCDVKKEHPQIIQELHDSQVNLIHVSSTSKNAADEKLRQSLRRFAELHPAPSAILLISGDINFAGDLSDLRYRKKIRVILVHNVNVADALILCANKHHLFADLTEDLPKTNGRKPATESASFCFLTISNLPKNFEQSRVKNRLHSLTYNCGGKCIEFVASEGIACLRFGNFDLALRAQKRIQGEDVFGNKIRVLSPSVRSFTGQRLRNNERSALPPLNHVPPPPPPGFNYENRQPITYPINQHNIDLRELRRNHQDGPSLHTPPITLDRSGPPFRPIVKMGLVPPQMGPHVMGPPSVSPMEVSFDQLQGGFNRRTPVCRQVDSQEHFSAAMASGAPGMVSYGRVHKISGSSEYSDTSDVKGFVPSELSTKNQANQPVDLIISNLDPTIDVKELRRLLSNMVKEYAMILGLSVIVQADGTPIANLKVSSQQEAQFTVSQLHRQKLGHKKIVISYAQNNSPDPEQLRVMVISVLQDVPDRRMPLFKFMEILESRYHCTVSVSEVNKLKDVVRITDEMGSRMISLTQEARVSPTHNLTQNMIPYCLIHCPKGLQNVGWCELNSSYIPNIMMPLSMFAPKLLTLLNVHMGSMPLLSFQACYERECQEPLPVTDSGVPLEHLITCVPNVEIKLVGPNKSIKVIRHEVRPSDSDEDPVLKTVAPGLAPNVNLLCRELVDLLKTTDKCQLLLTKFIPAYHHHFGRQCRVADYGYTKLLDLFEAISHVVQILGDTRKVITLTHSAQIRRFTSDMLRVLKLQPNKQILFNEFASAYEKVLNRQFNPVEYGLCTFEDLLSEIPENTIVITRNDEGMYISVPKREQTPEEVMRTKQFANEVIDLLRHTPYYTMLFNKFVPSYHHHFGHQCRVSDYGFTKLIELFEAIPDVVEIKELPDGERTVSLTPRQSLKILGSQVTQVIKNVGGGTLKLEELPVLYFREFGYPLNPQVYQCETVTEVVEKLSEYVQVIHSNAGTLLRSIEMDTLPNILRVRCWALLLCPPHVKDIPTFRYEYQHCYKNSFCMDSLKQISNVVSISSMNNTDFISLTSLYVLAAQLYYVICNNGGSVVFSHLERLYMDNYNKPLKLSSFNINTVNEFYNHFNLMFYIRGSKKKSIVVLNRNLQEHLAPLATLKYDNDTMEEFVDEATENQWCPPSVSSGDIGQGATKKFSPPKPDTPPTPGSSLWNMWSTPTKFENPSLNFSINMPITHNPILLGNPKHLISPARQLLPVHRNPWTTAQSAILAPEAHELPLPDKLLPKEGVSDDSGDSGVNIRLENSPSDNEIESSSSDNQGTSKKSFYGTFLNFK